MPEMNDSPTPADAASSQTAQPAPNYDQDDRETLIAKLTAALAQLEDSTSRARETQARLKEEHERLLRTAAEFDNFKKRALKEKDDVRKYGAESMLKDFLPVADNLERALDHAEQHDPKQVIEGVRLVQKMFESALGKHGINPFSALGQMFDPSMHEALMQAESEEPAGKVIQEMARGYKLHERLVRPAAVVVARAKEAPAAADDSSAEPLN